MGGTRRVKEERVDVERESQAISELATTSQWQRQNNAHPTLPTPHHTTPHHTTPHHTPLNTSPPHTPPTPTLQSVEADSVIGTGQFAGIQAVTYGLDDLYDNGMDPSARVGKHGNKKFAPRKEVPCGNGDEGGWSELKMIQQKMEEEEKKVSGET